MPLLDVQRKSQQIGRLRIGQQVKASNGKMRPARLDTFRFTVGSRVTAEAIAGLYGGEVRDWSGEFEVITGKSEIGVTVPPRDEVVSQWYEMWTKGGCQRRCDSEREQISNGPCLCPPAQERAELARLNPPQACKMVTRISVMIPDLPGLGVFRLDTGSYYAAVEIGDAAQLMQVARDKGVFLPAMLRIEQRQRVAGGQTKKFPVPVLEVLATFRDLATGAIEAAGIGAQLPPAPGETRLAITATAPSVPPARQAPPRHMTAQEKAQDIADRARQAATRAEIEQLDSEAEAGRVGDDTVCTYPEEDVHEELRTYLRARWKELPAGGAQ